ncbi:MAG: hypothetical protein WCK55_17285 [Verrucomicrobiota bacterium]
MRLFGRIIGRCFLVAGSGIAIGMIVFSAFLAVKVVFAKHGWPHVTAWEAMLYYSRFIVGGLLIAALGAFLERMTKDK